MEPFAYPVTNPSDNRYHSRRIESYPLKNISGPQDYYQWYKDVRNILDEEAISDFVSVPSPSGSHDSRTSTSNESNTATPSKPIGQYMSDYTKHQLNAVTGRLYRSAYFEFKELLDAVGEPVTISKMIELVRNRIPEVSFLQESSFYSDLTRSRKRSESIDDFLHSFMTVFEILYDIEDPRWYLTIFPEMVFKAHEKHFSPDLVKCRRMMRLNQSGLFRNDNPSLEWMIDNLKMCLPISYSNKRQKPEYTRTLSAKRVRPRHSRTSQNC